MNIPFLSPVDKDAIQRQLSAPKTGPRGKLLSDGQAARAARRQQHRDAVATAKRSRRNGFLQDRLKHDTEQTLQSWARIYFGDAGNEHMRRNVTEAVHRQAELHSKANGVPFTKSLEQAEETLRAAREGAAA